MSNIYANTGVDIDLMFFTGSGASTTGIYDDTGQDIGLKYSAGSADWDTDIIASSGQDIGRILGGEILEVWRSKEVLKDASNKYLYKRYYDSVDSLTSAGWAVINKFDRSSSDWTKVLGTSEQLTVGYHRDRGETDKYVSCYAYYVRMVHTTNSCDITFGSPTTNDGSVWLSEIREPDAYTKTFLLIGRPGTDWDYITKDDNDTGIYYEDYPIYSYRTMTIAASIGGVKTRSYTVKWKY